MATPQAKLLVTVERYLEMEATTEERHEYIDGYVYAMADESDEHGDVSVDLLLLLGPQLEGGPCRIRTKDTKVRSGPVPDAPGSTKGLFSYPDLVVICGEPEHFDKQRRRVITNPKVIIEVLSPSTETKDRSVKFARYQTWKPTLEEYVLVAQDEPKIEVYTRQGDGSWRYVLYQGLEQTARLASINCELPLERVYRRVTFAVAEEEAEPGE